MKILFEVESYDKEVLEKIFNDKSYYEKGKDGNYKPTYIGYYRNKNEITYILPKVFMQDDKKTTIFKKSNDEKYTKYELLKIDDMKSDDMKSKIMDPLNNLMIYFYKSLSEYRKRKNNSKTIIKAEINNLKTNIGEDEYSYIDLLLTFIKFYKKNKDHILYKYIEYTSNIAKKVNWERTIRKSTPIFTKNRNNRYAPIYIKIRNRKKVMNAEEELIIYFLSIINSFNERHNQHLKINKRYNLIKGAAFEKLKDNGLAKLRKIKYRYFNDTFKRMYNLCDIYFRKTDKSSNKEEEEEYLLVKTYNNVFEDMVDKLISDESLKDFKALKDGKIIDHLFKYKSLLDDNSEIYYIGDSKYYNGNEVGENSIYKQFTYSRDIIYTNIKKGNIHKKNRKCNSDVCYRDDLTEGYNITPNFFIDGYIDDINNFDDDKLNKIDKIDKLNKTDKTDKIDKSYHFEGRLFDRDTLFILYYKINFLFILKAYTSNNSKAINFKKSFQEKVRENFREYLNLIVTFYEIKLKEEETVEDFIEKHFKILNGKCYRTKGGKFILALYNNDNFKDNFEEFSKYFKIVAKL